MQYGLDERPRQLFHSYSDAEGRRSVQNVGVNTEALVPAPSSKSVQFADTHPSPDVSSDLPRVFEETLSFDTVRNDRPAITVQGHQSAQDISHSSLQDALSSGYSSSRRGYALQSDTCV